MPDAANRLSVAIITLNAARELEACLESVKFADEILVIDAGSSDETPAIAERAGARVMQRDWEGFGKQKQFAVDAARNDWVLSIDADERVGDALRENIVAALRLPEFKAYQMPRKNRFLGRYLNHGEGYPDWSLRLFHRAHARWSEDDVHEKVIADCALGRLNGDLLHDSAEDLARYLEKQNRYTSLQAQKLYRDGSRAGAWQLVTSPIGRFIKFYLLRFGFLDGAAGFAHIAIGCFNSFSKYAKLIELTKAQQEKVA